MVLAQHGVGGHEAIRHLAGKARFSSRPDNHIQPTWATAAFRFAVIPVGDGAVYVAEAAVAIGSVLFVIWSINNYANKIRFAQKVTTSNYKLGPTPKNPLIRGPGRSQDLRTVDYSLLNVI